MALFTSIKYPVFNIESIANRCEKDFSDFVLQEKMDNKESEFTLVKNGLATKDALDRALKPMKEFIETKLPDSYVKSISTVSDPQLQRELWIARTFLFYQLMIFVVAILGNRPLYTEVFGEPDNKSVFPFREGFAPELEYYQMGIFGSKTPTSDIDVGVQYVGTSSEMPGLAYMISAFENVFLKLTGKSSLDFDIESYADMYLYKGDNGSDYFYLDIGKITVDEFKRILPVAGQSIARNVFIDHGTRPESFEQVVDTVTLAINSSSTLDTGLDKGHADFLANVKNPEIEAALKEPTWFKDSMTKMEKFLKLTYDEQRAQYYEAVQVAETLKFAKAPTFEAAKSLDNNTICELIVALGNALSYRMESYTASPTITHVVRILQANTEVAEKYATKSPIELCNGVEKGEDPYCSIGKYGFIISILEQIGYMYRFYEHYCLKGGNPKKCATKMKKYGKRYNNAFMSYDGFSVISPVVKPVILQVVRPGINPAIIRHHVRAVGGGKRTRRKRRTMKKHKNRRTKNKRRMCKGLKA